MELLELFSMAALGSGVTLEDDIKECARAFKTDLDGR